MTLLEKRRRPLVAQESGFLMLPVGAGAVAGRVPCHAAHSLSSASSLSPVSSLSSASPLSSASAPGAFAPRDMVLFELAPGGIDPPKSGEADCDHHQVFDARFRRPMLRRGDRSQYEAASS
jgi:hypothetical protein